MKKTATLVAGLLLVTGTVFASEWKMTGATVEGTFDVVNTQTGSLNSNGGDLNLTFKTEKEFTAGTVGVEAKFDKLSEDNSVKLSYSKTEGDFTVATTAKILTTDGSTTDGKISLKTNEDSDTYIKWNVMGSKMTSLTFYPWKVDGMSWDNDTWESFTTSNNGGGLKLAVKLADTTDFAVKFAATEGGQATTVAGAKVENKTQYSVKGEFNTKVSDLTVNAAAGYSTGSKTTMMAAKASMPIAALTVNAELNTEKVDKNDAKVGVFVKGSYKLAEMNGYMPTAYASFESITTPDQKSTTTTDEKVTDTEIEAGLGMAKGSFTITPKVILNSSSKENLVKENATAKSKSATKLAVTVKYSM